MTTFLLILVSVTVVSRLLRKVRDLEGTVSELEAVLKDVKPEERKKAEERVAARPMIDRAFASLRAKMKAKMKAEGEGKAAEEDHQLSGSWGGLKARAAVVVVSLFAIGCGGLRPSSVPSFGEQREYNCRITGPDGTVWLGVWNREAIAESKESGPEARRQLNLELVCIPKVVAIPVGEISCVGPLCWKTKKRK